MMWDSQGWPTGMADADLGSGLTDEQWAALKENRAPGEAILWAERAGPPPSPTVPAFPAFFAAMLCGASGFALMVLFGIYGLRTMELAETLFYLGLAPGALGAVVALGVLGRWVHHLRARWRLSRTFYAVTDRRAMVGSDAQEVGTIAIASWTPDLFDNTLCIERQDGSGDVFFVRDGDVIWPEEGFVEVARARQVEALVRRVLLGRGPEVCPFGGTGLDLSHPIVPSGD